MMNLCSDVLNALAGRTLVTAESCTGGGIGHALTAVAGSSSVYKGGIISYCNDVKNNILKVDGSLLEKHGAVSAPVAEAMALQSLPKEFCLPPDITLSACFKTIGNGVPLMLAQGVAKTLFEYLQENS